MNAPSFRSADTEGTGRITPDAPASPAPPQGEREFADWFKVWALEPGPDSMRAIAEAAWNASRASLSASTPSAEARDSARLVSDLSLLVNRMAHRLSRRAGGEGTEAGDREMARQASVFLRRKNLATPLRDDAAMAPPADNKENGNG